MSTVASRSLRLGSRSYPVVLPTLGDPRLHLAAVIVSIHVLGQVALGFRVSVPQIAVAILTCAVIETVWTFVSSRRIVWPASAMLTGSGVALILRLVDARRGDHWTWEGWYLFALVAGGSLLSKYLIRQRGTQVFNPSNVGLVAAFLVLGRSVVEPLDFWWGPPGPSMVAAYLIIVLGGLAITGRLGLIGMAVAFWSGLSVSLGVLAASGHCITAAWSVEPVCGTGFWSVVVTSPEVLVFLFFMITDPKTIPRGRMARIGFAVAVAMASTLLIAPGTTEFAAKVGLLAGLVLVTPFRAGFDRLERRRREAVFGLLTEATRWRLFGAGAALGAGMVIVMAGVVVAGGPARAPAAAVAEAVPVDVEIDPGTLPPVTVVAEAAHIQGGTAPEELAVALARALAVEGEAIRRGDTSLLRSADDGERLTSMERRIEIAVTSGRFDVPAYHFDTLRLDVVFTDGPQGGASLAMEATGMIETVTLDTRGSELGRTEDAFAGTFVLRPATGDRWLIATGSP